MSPTLVGFFRGLLIAIVLAVLGAIATVLGNVDLNDIDPNQRWLFVGVLATAVRTIEGLIDKLRGQAPQQSLGSKPADPNAYT